jgi:hypothetical protein
MATKKKTYILEEQVFIENKGFQHIGYVNKIFNSKEEAILYYDEFNSHMPSLRGKSNYTSNIDPKTKIRSKIRVYDGEILYIPYQEKD